jgi:hypothetical protein
MRPFRSAFVVFICFYAAVSVEAADHPISVSSGFSALGSGSCCLPTTGSIPVGWYGEFSIPVVDGLHLVTEFGGDYEAVQVLPPGFLPFPSVRYRRHAFVTGPRVAVHAGHCVELFGEMLLGVVHQNSHFQDLGGGELSNSLDRFAWQPGGGVDLRLTNRVAVRLAGGYRLMPSPGRSPTGRTQQAQPRFMTGIVLTPSAARRP